jgi:alkylation response protein AidB-like acyl-CoA dehydrogenase
LDEAAEALRHAAREVLEAEVTSEVIRSGAFEGAWDKLVAVGVIGTLVAAEQGGLALDESALVPVLDEIGYSGLPVPAVETIAVASPLVSRSFGPTILVAAVLDGDVVPFGQVAELIVLRDGDSLRVYERDELTLEPCTSIDASRLVARVVDHMGVRGRAGEGEGGVLLTDDPAEIERAWQRGVLGTAAVLTGLARRMLDITVDYVKGREQFGVPVGSFQAIKHALADALVALEFARPLVLAAAWAQAAGAQAAGAQAAGAQAAGIPDADVLTSAAKVRATAAAQLMARTAIQCHGAMGYTTDYDLHLFAKRVWALAPSWGGQQWHKTRIAENLGVADG